MDEVHSQGRKALLILVFFTLGSTLLFAFSPANASSSDSTAFNASSLVNLESDLRHDIVGFSTNYLGLKYRYAGRRPETGFDCSGFTHFVMGTFGISLSPSSVQQSHQGEKIKVQDTEAGDLIFFRRSARSRISHVAMVVSNDENGLFIIHSTSRGIVIDNLMKSAYWRPKIYSARRVINVNQEETMAAIQSLFECDGTLPSEDEAVMSEDVAIADNADFLCVEPLPTLPLRVISR